MTEFFCKTKKLVGSKGTRKWRRKPYRYKTCAINRDPIARSLIDQQLKKDPESPLDLTRRWWDYP